MTSTDSVVAFKAPTPSETAALMFRARQMRSRAIVTMLGAAASFAVKRLRGIFTSRNAGATASQA